MLIKWIIIENFNDQIMKPNEAFNNTKEEANDLKAKINNLINKFAQISVPPYNQQGKEQIQSGLSKSKK